MHPSVCTLTLPTPPSQRRVNNTHTPTPRRHWICKPPPAHLVHCRKARNLPLLFSPYQLQGTPNPHGQLQANRFTPCTCMTLSTCFPCVPSGCDAVQGVLALHCNTANKIWQQRLNPHQHTRRYHSHSHMADLLLLVLLGLLLLGLLLLGVPEQCACSSSSVSACAMVHGLIPGQPFRPAAVLRGAEGGAAAWLLVLQAP